MSKKYVFTKGEFEEIRDNLRAAFEWIHRGGELRRGNRMTQKHATDINQVIRKLNIQCKEFTVDDWQDDDSPQAERTFGTCKVAA